MDDDESSPSHYDNELPCICFDLSVDQNTAQISPVIINRGITVSGRTVIHTRKPCFDPHVQSATCIDFQRTTCCSSSPSEADTGSSGSGTSKWQRIAQKLQEVFFSSLGLCTSECISV